MTNLIDTATACKILGVCQQRVRQFVVDGRLVSIRAFARRHAFERRAVEAFAKARKNGRKRIPKKS